jgi:homoserine kinase type II
MSTSAATATVLKTILSDHYDLGELVDYEQLHLGYCNISYVIWLEHEGTKKRYFLRRYRTGTGAAEIQFEHSVISHLVNRGFDLIAGIIPTRDGCTYVEINEGDGAAVERAFYSVFDFLPGEDRYAWVDPCCEDCEIEGAATVLARFHSAVYDLDPAGKRDEPGIVQLLPRIEAKVEQLIGQVGETVFDDCLLGHLELIRDAISHTRQALEGLQPEALVHQVIHCDFHPGNLKFQGDRITGLFDFDWSKVDARSFDVGLALYYFCTAWFGEKAGELCLPEISRFLATYQRTLVDEHPAGPLGAAELAPMPYMISASNIYVMNWTLVDFYSKEVDPVEYRVFLQHSTGLMEWLSNRDNWQALQQAIAGSAIPE